MSGDIFKNCICVNGKNVIIRRIKRWSKSAKIMGEQKSTRMIGFCPKCKGHGFEVVQIFSNNKEFSSKYN